MTSIAGEQLSLELFPPRSFEELCTSGSDPVLIVHRKPRLKKNWYVKIHRNRPLRELFIPKILDDAPEAIKVAMINWATLSSSRKFHKKRETKIRRRAYEELIRTYLTEQLPVSDGPPPSQKWPTLGCRYDLKEVFDTLNKQYFEGKLTCFLRWGTGTSKTSYQSTRKDSSGQLYHRITIAGVYDHPDVPRYAIEAIMYHEMLHIHIPPRRENGRNVIHGADFAHLERSFLHFAAWRQWERDTLPRLHTGKKRRHRFRNVKEAVSRLFSE